MAPPTPAPIAFTPLAEAPRDIPTIAAQERASIFPHWSPSLAYTIGTTLRTRLLSHPSPAVIHVSTPTSPPHVLFHATTHPGTTPDNDVWVARKRAAVVRWGVSTWQLQQRFGGDEEKFRQKLGLGEGAGQYAIHGGGVPVYVKGVEGCVAVVVVSGLKQWDDHQVVVEGLAEVLAGLEEE
ncbi:hypothetical protein C7974DRAFT_436466 [Boeremia exigua]|uniref:uncharacterized protein n=1 Tax=Boeremia exigua TaxID=749465 RepID=UPI001E8D78C5|nr:uncharacterized protein C7974DRAFT_436466 [Boeremia exigua]KAH6616444.1 hypothetical protein C7974DRAFT_436466 [Boeremia exigua]